MDQLLFRNPLRLRLRGQHARDASSGFESLVLIARIGSRSSAHIGHPQKGVPGPKAGDEARRREGSGAQGEEEKMRPAVTSRRPPRRPPDWRQRAQVRRSPSLRRVTAVPASGGTTKRTGSERCSFHAVLRCILRLRGWAPRPGALFRSPAKSASLASWRGIDRGAAMPAPSVRFRAFVRCEGTPRSQTIGASFCRPVVAGRGAEEKGVGVRSAIGGLQARTRLRCGLAQCRQSRLQRAACRNLNLILALHGYFPLRCPAGNRRLGTPKRPRGGGLPVEVLNDIIWRHALHYRHADFFVNSPTECELRETTTFIALPISPRSVL